MQIGMTGEVLINRAKSGFKLLNGHARTALKAWKLQLFLLQMNTIYC